MKPSDEILKQYRALTAGVGIAELAGRTIIAVTGGDRVSFLQSFTTNDVKKLVPGRGCEAFVTNSQGKTLGHILIFCEPNQLVLDTSAGQAESLIAHFNRYVITEDVQFVDRTKDLREFLIAGEKSAELLASQGVERPSGVLEHARATIAGCSVIVRRVEYAGPQSFFIQTTANDAATVAEALISAGAVRCDEAIVESVRIEAGFPLFGLDITDDNLPQEVGRDAKAVSFTKGCYLGQETVARIDALGHVNRLLVRLRSDSDQVPASGDSLLAGEQQIGHVTSAAWSPRLSAPLAFGYVRRIYAKAGTKLATAAGPCEVI
jgi:folate-binding protein YgfZ